LAEVEKGDINIYKSMEHEELESAQTRLEAIVEAHKRGPPMNEWY